MEKAYELLGRFLMLPYRSQSLGDLNAAIPSFGRCPDAQESQREYDQLRADVLAFITAGGD